jgi:hypothetical protein
MKSLSKEDPVTHLFRWVSNGYRLVVSAFRLRATSAPMRVVEDHVYVEELNSALRAHPAYKKGMEFALRDPGSIAASTEDIVLFGMPAGHPLFQQIMDDVATRCELEPLPFP